MEDAIVSNEGTRKRGQTQDVTTSIKLWWSAETLGNGDVLGVLFGDREETLQAARVLIKRLKQSSDRAISLRQMRKFAESLSRGEEGARYSYHNFYTKLIRKLLTMGLLEKRALWNAERGTTVRVYQLRVQQTPRRPPESGFVRLAWLLAKGWNDLVQAPA